MIAPSNIVSLRVAGTVYQGWTRVSVTAGIERAARDFRFDITRQWPGDEGMQHNCRPGDSCVLMIGDDRILTGYIDAVPVQYDSGRITLGLSGRSKTADLIDCSAPSSPGQWLGQSVEQIASALAAPYGISVRSEADTGATISDHQVQQGETAFESIDRLLKQRQLLATDDSDGALVFIKPGTRSATTALVLGQNILTADYPNDWKDRYSTYTCKGQGSGTDDAFGADVSEAEGTATDTAVTRHRLLIVQQSGQADTISCDDRAAYERDLRAARSQAVTYTVQGWRQADGSLWQPNMIVRVTDALLGLDLAMLITEVTYTLDQSGTLATLAVMPPEAHLGVERRRKTKKKKYV